MFSTASNDTNKNGMTLRRVLVMTDQEARLFIESVRWSDSDGNPVCPACSHREAYYLEKRQKYKCKSCYRQFTVTSGTCMAALKASIQTWLARAYIFASGAKGISSLQMARLIGEQQRSSYHAMMLFREAIDQSLLEIRLSGEVEIDGATFGGHRRFANMAVESSGRRKRFAVKETKNRCVIVVARQRGGRTVPMVVDKESDAIEHLKLIIEPGTVVHADCARGWNGLQELYSMMRVSHAWAFSENGACTNSSESFFSRMRKLHSGTHHKITKGHMYAYASEAAWRTDRSSMSNTERTIDLLRIVLSCEKTRTVALPKKEDDFIVDLMEIAA